MRASWRAVVLLTALGVLPSRPVEVLGEVPEGGTLSGMVRDAHTHKPIAWANISVGPKSRAITESNGTYRVWRIPPGEYEVVVQMQGYEDRIVEGVQILPGEETPLFVEMREEGWEAKELRRGRQEARHISPAEEASVVQVADSANVFAWELYHVLSRTEGNLFFSPFSVSAAMAMTSAGAAGGTRAQMKSALHLWMDDTHLHAAWGELLGSLLRGAEVGSYRLNIANRLWGQDGRNFLDPFLVITREQYGAQLQRADFQRKPEESRQSINEWVARETEGRITNLIPAGGVDSSTRLVLVNAIYFLGLWEHPFPKRLTKDEFFFLSDTDSILVPMMHTTWDCRYAEIAEADMQLLEMPYESDQISMLVVLPRKRVGIGRLEQGMDAVRLGSWTEVLRDQTVRVHFPRLRLGAEMELKQSLSELGMPSAFAPGGADFSLMDGTRDLFISAVYHKSFVEVSEEGTEAAAATAGGISMGVIGPGASPPSPLFRVDRPFLFLIRDRLSGAILFMGRVVNPSLP